MRARSSSTGGGTESSGTFHGCVVLNPEKKLGSRWDKARKLATAVEWTALTDDVSQPHSIAGTILVPEVEAMVSFEGTLQPTAAPAGAAAATRCGILKLATKELLAGAPEHLDWLARLEFAGGVNGDTMEGNWSSMVEKRAPREGSDDGSGVAWRFHPRLAPPSLEIKDGRKLRVRAPVPLVTLLTNANDADLPSAPAPRSAQVLFTDLWPSLDATAMSTGVWQWSIRVLDVGRGQAESLEIGVANPRTAVWSRGAQQQANGRLFTVNSQGHAVSASTDTAFLPDRLHSDDLVTVRLDVDRGRLSFKVNGSNCGIAHRTLRGQGPFLPAVVVGRDVRVALEGTVTNESKGKRGKRAQQAKAAAASVRNVVAVVGKTRSH